MKIRVLVPHASLEAASGDVIEVDDDQGVALVGAGLAEETTDKVGPAPEPVLPEPEAPMEEPEAESEVAEEVEEVEDTGTGDYEGRTRLQLVQLARNKGIKGAAQMKKDELIEALRG